MVISCFYGIIPTRLPPATFLFPSLLLPGPSQGSQLKYCAAVQKALHLPVITSHPSLPRLLGVKPALAPSCAPCGLAPVPFTPLEDTPLIMWLAPLSSSVARCFGGLCVAQEHCRCCDARRLLLACPPSGPRCPHNATFSRALNPAPAYRRTGPARQRPCLNRMHLVCLPAQGQGQPGHLTPRSRTADLWLGVSRL